jgi:hypothetical protein
VDEEGWRADDPKMVVRTGIVEAASRYASESAGDRADAIGNDRFGGGGYAHGRDRLRNQAISHRRVARAAGAGFTSGRTAAGKVPRSRGPRTKLLSLLPSAIGANELSQSLFDNRPFQRCGTPARLTQTSAVTPCVRCFPHERNFCSPRHA